MHVQCGACLYKNYDVYKIFSVRENCFIKYFCQDKLFYIDKCLVFVTPISYHIVSPSSSPPPSLPSLVLRDLNKLKQHSHEIRRQSC